MQQPKLRFKTDNKNDFPNWEEKELGQILTEDLCPVKNPDNAYTKLSIRSHGKGTFDHYVVAGESLDVDKMFEVKANRLILNITFAWELAIAITTKKDEGKLVSHRFPQYKIDGDVNFYKYRFINERMQYDLGVASPGGAGRNRVLNKSDFLKIKKYIPSLPEQQKIASLFTEIDNLIKSSEKELEGYKEFKKGMLQKMFPKKGEKVPEVRFPGFDGEWEEKKLGDLYIKAGSGGTPLSSNKEYYDGDINFLGISDITNSNGLIINTSKKITEAGLNNSSAWIVPTGSISLAMYASVGKVAILGVDCATSQAFYNMIFEKDETRDFVYQLLKYNEIFECWSSLISTGTQPNLNAQKIKNYIVLIPSLEEQQKIGSFFKSLDEEIELQKQKVELIKEYKKGLLQQMFV